MTGNYLSQMIFFAIGTLALIALSLFFARKFRKQMKPYFENLETLAKNLSGIPCKLHGFFDSEPSLAGHWFEHKFTFRYCSSDFFAAPHSLQLKLFIRPSIKFSIYANYMRPSKVLFLKKTYTGEVDLDKFDFYSNKPDEAKKYLISHQTILKQLSDSGWSMPVFNRRTISIFTDVNRSIDAETIKSALRNLNELETETRGFNQTEAPA